MSDHNRAIVEMLVAERQATLYRDAEEGRLARLFRRSARRSARKDHPAAPRLLVAPCAADTGRDDMHQVA